MNQLVFITENPGKLREVGKFASQYGVEILSPSQVGLLPNEIKETGKTYEENARIKVEACLGQKTSKQFVICGDDSGMEIEALNNEPGVNTRRWLGYEMSDDEIIGYTLGRLYGITDDKRKVVSKTVVAYSVNGQPISCVSGELYGRITQTPFPQPRQEGFPFRQLFVVSGDPEIPMLEFDALTPQQRDGRLSHRESAFLKLFQALDWVK